MNWRRGFNRLYLVLSVCWAVGMPLKWAASLAETNRQLSETLLEGSREEQRNVFQLRAEGRHNEANLAQIEFEKTRQMSLDSLADANLAFGLRAIFVEENNWRWTLVFMFVPPAIVYGLLAGSYVLIRWIVRGFTSAEGTPAP